MYDSGICWANQKQYYVSYRNLSNKGMNFETSD